MVRSWRRCIGEGEVKVEGEKSSGKSGRHLPSVVIGPRDGPYSPPNTGTAGSAPRSASKELLKSTTNSSHLHLHQITSDIDVL